MERATGIEPATSCLGSRRSTAELHPLGIGVIPRSFSRGTKAVPLLGFASYILLSAGMALPSAYFAGSALNFSGQSSQQK